MLKHEDNPQIQTLSAAQVRVTPEELAAAMTALQIRKEGQPGTIAIGDAVEELGLDVTPEEVLAEVQKRRGVPKRRLDYCALACAIICAVPLAFGTFLARSTHSNVAATPTPILAQTEALSDVGNGQQVYIDTHGLEQIIEGTPEAKVQVYADNKDIRWGLIKHGGKAYIQAYTFKTTEQGLRNNSIKLFNSEHPNNAPFYSGMVFDNQGFSADVKVTLPASALQYQDSQQVDGISRVLVKEVKPDDHVWDGF